jgi:hypothetical protein
MWSCDSSGIWALVYRHRELDLMAHRTPYAHKAFWTYFGFTAVHNANIELF